LSDVTSRRLAAVTVALALAFGAVACGDDDDDDGGDTAARTTEETADATEVTVTADEVSQNEFSFELSATPTAETETVVFDNQGELDHALVFGRINEGFTVDEAFELEGRQGSAVTLVEGGARPGKTETFEITEPLEPGNYAMLCPIPGPGGEPHYKLGQLEEFTIE
jgi:uncharacterized cupredoxin-like copper-binding protein